MSNVRPRRVSRTTRASVLGRAASQGAFAQRCRAAAAHLLRRAAIRPFAAGEPPPLGSEKAFVSVGATTHARAQTRNANAFQSAAALQGAAESKRWSVRGRQCSGSGEVGAPTVTMVPLSSFRSRCRGVSNSRASAARPNPSIEGTCNGGPHWFASARPATPLHAPHVKR